MKVSKSQTGQGMAVVIIGVVVALAVGFAVGDMVGNNKDDDSNKSSTSSSSMMSGDTDGVTVGGAKMVQSKDIVDNAANAKNVSTLVAAVKAADLVDTLKMPGPYTVFGPNNDAFNALPAGTLDTLLKPENKSQLVNILTYHVVPGTYTSADLRVMATKGETLTSVQGEKLTPVIENNAVMIQDAKGNKVAIETPDVISSNGVTHVIKAVLMP